MVRTLTNERIRYLTKSEFLNFWDNDSCALWLRIHRPDLYNPQTDQARNILSQQGQEIDLLARKLFPDAVEVQGYNERGWQNTRRLMRKGVKALIQPTIMSGRLSNKADIMTYNDNTGSWNIHEVKSSTRTQEHHLVDLAFQRVCAEEAGLAIGKTFLIHVNHAYVKQGEIEPFGIFDSEDVTDAVKNMIPQVQREIRRALSVMEWSKKPGVHLLHHCKDPRTCAYLPYYMNVIPDDEIKPLLEKIADERIRALLERGLLLTRQVPTQILENLGEINLPSTRSPIGEAAEKGIRLNIRAIRDQLNYIIYPVHVLNINTHFNAIPLFDGYRPYQHIPYQFSVLRLKSPDSLPEKIDFLAQEFEDPTQDLIMALRKAVGDKGSLIIWNKDVFAKRILDLARSHPNYVIFLHSLKQRVFDEQILFKKRFITHPAFKSNTSPQTILSVIKSSQRLETRGIKDAISASGAWRMMITPGLDVITKAELKNELEQFSLISAKCLLKILEYFYMVSDLYVAKSTLPV